MKARCTGIFAARCLVRDLFASKLTMGATTHEKTSVDTEIDFLRAFSFELFTHVTNLFGQKVIITLFL
jgi:hypothetical protein